MIYRQFTLVKDSTHAYDWFAASAECSLGHYRTLDEAYAAIDTFWKRIAVALAYEDRCPKAR